MGLRGVPRILSLELRKQIIREHKNGARITDLARKFNLANSTLERILINKEEILRPRARRNTTKPIKDVEAKSLMDKVENVLLVWINERQMKADLTTRMVICKKARRIYAELKKLHIDSGFRRKGNPKKFKASSAWFQGFKRRNGFQSVFTQKEAASSKERYIPGQLLNSDENRPSCRTSYGVKKEKNSSGPKPTENGPTLRAGSVKNCSSSNSPKTDQRPDSGLKRSANEFKPNSLKEKEKVKRKDLFERLAAATKPDSKDGIQNSEANKKNILEKPSEIVEISISVIPKPTSEASISSKAAGEDGKETEIDILERLTDSLNNIEGAEESVELSNDLDWESLELGDITIDSDAGDFDREINASEWETSKTLFQIKEAQDFIQTLLTDPSARWQDEEDSDYSTITENQVQLSFSTFSEDQWEQETTFSSDIQNTSSNVGQPQEDTVLPPKSPEHNTDLSFLHYFSSEHETSESHEESEFISLDRLEQILHQQSFYGADPSSSMQYHCQQQQGISNPSPQVNVIFQHYLPGLPPPQLHSGFELSPHQTNSYDSVFTQPPLPPTLCQEYTYNQVPQFPQPQMPTAQPYISSRSFQSMPVPQERSRPRLAVKRTPIRSPQEKIATTKQPRINPLLSMRAETSSSPTKLPSGITTTPTEETLEYINVANALASRGITVTPSQQANESVRPRSQERTQSGFSGSALNISSAVSVTSSEQNFPRHSTPIVNDNMEKFEEFMTEDSIQDDDVSQSQAQDRAIAGRFFCHLCGKVFESLAAHKIHHWKILPYKCDLCSATYNDITPLVSHREICHEKMPASDLAIPIVDLNHPGVRDELRKCGVYSFIPLAQVQSNSNEYFGVPIIQVDTANE